jgi:MFS family permease
MRLGFFGWRVVFATFWVATFSWGLGFYGLAVYLTQLRAQHGWSTSTISAAATFYYLFSAVLVAYAPDVFRRFGPRRCILAGVAAFAVSLLPLLNAPWQLFAVYALMSLGWATMSLAAINATLAPWFVRRRGLAVSLALTGASGGGVFVSPALIWASSQWGFAAAAWTLVAVMIAMLVPMTLLWVRASPASFGLGPDGDPAATTQAAGQTTSGPVPSKPALLRSGAYWSVAAPFALALMAQVGFLTHQVALLQGPLGVNGAALAVALTTSAAIAGRLGLGAVVDRLDRRKVAAASLVSQAFAMAALIAFNHPLAPYGACILFGLSVGNIITLPSLVVQREFDAAAFGVVVGLIAGTSQVFYAFGPGLLGLARDFTGGYAASLALCLALQLLAAALILRRPSPRA